MATPENPPAFPPSITTTAAGDVYHGFDGMTLRDWFASGIASALCTATDSSGLWMAPVDDPGCRIIAERAYKVADAMLAARQTTDREDGK